MTYGENEISPPTPPYAEGYRGPDDRSAGAAVGVPGKKKIIFKLDATAATDAYDACLHRPWAPGSPEEEKNFRPGRGVPGDPRRKSYFAVSVPCPTGNRRTDDRTAGSEKKKKKLFFIPSPRGRPTRTTRAATHGGRPERRWRKKIFRPVRATTARRSPVAVPAGNFAGDDVSRSPRLTRRRRTQHPADLSGPKSAPRRRGA